MPNLIKTVDYNGRKVQGELVDGSRMKMKTVLLEVVRVLGEYNPTTGEPVYVFPAQQIVGIDAPDSLKKPKA